jgi:hypothetical protein
LPGITGEVVAFQPGEWPLVPSPLHLTTPDLTLPEPESFSDFLGYLERASLEGARGDVPGGNPAGTVPMNGLAKAAAVEYRLFRAVCTCLNLGDPAFVS